MNLKARIAKLEKLAEDRAVKIGFGPGVEVLTRERQAITNWLAENQVTIKEAIAAGLTGPADLQYVTLPKLLAAKESAAAWRHARFGADGIEIEVKSDLPRMAQDATLDQLALSMMTVNELENLAGLHERH